MNASATLAMLERTVILVKPLYTWPMIVYIIIIISYVALQLLSWALSFIVLLVGCTLHRPLPMPAPDSL